MALIDGYLGYLDIGGGLKSQWRLRIFAIFVHSNLEKDFPVQNISYFSTGLKPAYGQIILQQTDSKKACTQKMVVGRQVFPIAAAVRFRECRIYCVWEHCGITLKRVHNQFCIYNSQSVGLLDCWLDSLFVAYRTLVVLLVHLVPKFNLELFQSIHILWIRNCLELMTLAVKRFSPLLVACYWSTTD